MKKTTAAIGLILFLVILIDARVYPDDVLPFTFLECTIPKTAVSDRERACLKGNVRMVTTENAGFVRRDGQDVKIEVSTRQIAVYDKWGNLIEWLRGWSKDDGIGGFTDRTVYNFNSTEVATGWKRFRLPNRIPVAIAFYTIDSEGKVIRQLFAGPNHRTISIHKYDPEGKKLEERRYSVPVAEYSAEYDKKFLSSRKKYTYKGKNLIQTVDYDREGLVTRKSTYAGKNLIQTTDYNWKGLVTQKAKYEGKDLIQITSYEKGLVLYKYIFTYENGNKKENNHYSRDADGRLNLSWRIFYEYDQKGNLIEETNYDREGSVKTRKVYRFDDNGFRIGQNAYGSNGKVIFKQSLKYTYDSHGNWISLKADPENWNERTNANDPLRRISRTITYH